jgi:adenylate kinase family enzyme
LYGPPGNGKTTIAEFIGHSLPGEIYIPYSVLAGDQVIIVYDQVNHKAINEKKDDHLDQRWIKIKRPVVIAGGELTLQTLDLSFNSDSKYYEAPLQMKANNGLFIVDDFGRQIIDPQSLLNRWIIPLDRQIDFLTLHTGMKFEIPFDQLVIFATNLPPKKIADEAFLRRLRYKINLDYPTIDEYRQIFKNICDSNNIKYDENVFNHLIQRYEASKRNFSCCDPRDLIDHIIDFASFQKYHPLRQTSQSIGHGKTISWLKFIRLCTQSGSMIRNGESSIGIEIEIAIEIDSVQFCTSSPRYRFLLQMEQSPTWALGITAYIYFLMCMKRK